MGLFSNRFAIVRQTLLFLAILFVVFLGGTRLAAADVRTGLRTVAITGTAAPSPAMAGDQFNSFETATIGPTGMIAFHSYLKSGSPGLFFGSSPQNLQTIATVDTIAPGTNAQFINSNWYLPINIGNEVVALATIGGGDVTSKNGTGIWAGHPAADMLVMRQGSPVPLPTGQFFGPVFNTNFFYNPALNDGGQVAFQSGFQNSAGQVTSGAVANWITFAGSLAEVAATGGPVPGQPPTATFTGLGTPGLNNSGTVIYSGTFQSASAAAATGIFAATPGFTAPIELSGLPAPGTAPGVAFANVTFAEGSGSQVHVNQFNQTIFYGTLNGPGVTPTVNDKGVWVGGVGSSPVTLLARTGDAVPGLPAGATFTGFTDTGLSNTLNTGGILATITGANVQPGINDTGIWVGRPGNLHLVVRNGDVVPDGANPLTVALFTHFTMNGMGEILTQLRDGTLLGTNVLGQLTIVARPGDSIQVAPGDFRTISTIQFEISGNASGGPTQLNDSGLVSIAATFTDGTSGVFVSNALAVPEPSTLLLAALGIALCLRRSLALQTMTWTQWGRSAFIVCILACYSYGFVSAARAASYSFSWLGVMPGDQATYASAISDDGTTVVGNSFSNPNSPNGVQQAFRWTASTGMTAVGNLPNGIPLIAAGGVSTDGSVIAGSSYGQPYRWTQPNIMTPLGYLPGTTGEYGGADSISGNGLVIGGSVTGDVLMGTEPFLWSAATGMINIDTLGGGTGNQDSVYNLNYDGSMAVGMTTYGGERRAFLWTTSTGMHLLAPLPGTPLNPLESWAQDLSANGSVVVGYAETATSIVPFRWTPSGGMSALPLTAGSTRGEANGVSANGSIIVGYSNIGSTDHAIRWDPVLGAQSIESILRAHGYSSVLTGNLLVQAVSVSADGQTMTGWGYGPGGVQPWVATIPVPEPSTVALAMIGGLVLLAKVSRRFLLSR